jgi:hypothetical protein
LVFPEKGAAKDSLARIKRGDPILVAEPEDAIYNAVHSVLGDNFFGSKRIGGGLETV